MSPYCHSPYSFGDSLAQTNPLESLRRFYADDRPTESIQGFLNNGKKQLSCIIESNRITNREFQWFVTINHEHILPPAEINQEWKTFTNRTRRYYKDGLAFFWVREPTPSDPRKIHYHLAILTGFTDDRKTLEKVLDSCLSRLSAHHRSLKSAYPWHVAPYMLKLGESHRDKILLFRPELGFRRFGLAGHFLPPGISKKELEKRISTRERRISEGCSLFGNVSIAQYVARFLGVPDKRILRLIGESPYDPSWEKWLESMAGRDSRHV
jgi:hypothetical protein